MARTRRSTRHSLRLDEIGIHATTRRRSRNEEMRLKEEIEMPNQRRDELNGEVKENGLLRRASNGRWRKAKSSSNNNNKDGGVEGVDGGDEKREENADCNVEGGNDDDEEEEEEGEEVVEGDGKEVKQQENFLQGKEVKKTRTRAAVNNRISGNGIFSFAVNLV